jgi:hypothetical protein
MTITKRAGSVLFAGAAAAAMVALTASSALAATTLTVKVTGGGNYNGAANKTVLTDGTGATAVSVTCVTKGKSKASTASGKINNGTHKGAAPVVVGTAAKLSFNNCPGPLGQVTTKIHKTPYKISVDSKTNSKGQTDGIISGINVSVKNAACAFTVTGSSPGYYTNKTHTLTMTPKLPIKPLVKAQLTISGVNSGCLGVIKNGQHPTFTSTYSLSLKTTIKSS